MNAESIILGAAIVTIFAGLVTATIAVFGGVKTILRVGKWIQKRESFEETTEKAITKVNETIEAVRSDIKELFQQRQTVVPGSPLRLSELGETLSERLEAVEWAQNEAVPKILDESLIYDETPYGIQDFCFGFVGPEEGNLSDEMVKMVKYEAYAYGLDIEKVTNVLAIVLRDELLAIYNVDLPSPATTRDDK